MFKKNIFNQRDFQEIFLQRLSELFDINKNIKKIHIAETYSLHIFC